MNVLVALACALAVASAGWAPAAPVLGYQALQHVPVIHDGVPVETPEVQHAKVAHFAALAEAASRPGYQAIEQEAHKEYNYQLPALVHYAPAPIHEAPTQVHYSPTNYAAPKTYFKPAYETSHVLPAIGHDGSPLDTPEVEQAKQHHFAEFYKALAATAPHQPEEPQQYYYSEPAHHYRQRRSLYAHHNVPVDTIEVQLARAAHLAAHHSPAHGYSTHQVHAPVYGHHYEHWIPKYDHYGHPLDTAEVEHVKQAHFAAHHEAHYAAPAFVFPLSHNVPHDTPEVAHAKAAHFAAHAAITGHYY